MVGLDEAPDVVRADIDFRLGDVRDAPFVARACEGVDTVFHLAALIAIPYSYQAPQSFVETNVVGTLNVLEASRAGGIRRLVNTSTSEVYGTPESVPITEGHTLRAQSPYSATKIAANKLAESFHSTYETPVVTLRPFNTYGSRQSMRAVIPTILAQMLSGRSTIRLGNLEPRRDFTFVTDTVDGLIRAGAGADLEGLTIQLGTGRTESIAEIVHIARRVCGSDAEVTVEDERFRPEASEVMVLQSDPAAAADLLAWKATVELEEGIERTARWIEAHLSEYDPDTYSI